MKKKVKEKRAPQPVVPTEPAEAAEQTEIREKPDYLWLAGASLVTLIAAFLRFFWLELKPFHHDEGVNGFFLTNLVRDGVYKYDPANYHGPTLYYIGLPFAKLFGLETIPMRVSVAIFGVLTVVLVLYLRRYLGKTGSIFAALFVALSPGLVFISRYFIHEIFFVFLSLAIVVAVVFFIERSEAGPGAVVWMALLLLVCFIPSAFNIAKYLGGDSEAAVWTLRVVLLVVDAAIVPPADTAVAGCAEGVEAGPDRRRAGEAQAAGTGAHAAERPAVVDEDVVRVEALKASLECLAR